MVLLSEIWLIGQRICSDGASVAEGGDETLVPMTSDDPEVQDEVRHIIKKVHWKVKQQQRKNRCNLIERYNSRYGSPAIL